MFSFLVSPLWFLTKYPQQQANYIQQCNHLQKIWLVGTTVYFISKQKMSHKLCQTQNRECWLPARSQKWSVLTSRNNALSSKPQLHHWRCCQWAPVLHVLPPAFRSVAISSCLVYQKSHVRLLPAQVAHCTPSEGACFRTRAGHEPEQLQGDLKPRDQQIRN